MPEIEPKRPCGCTYSVECPHAGVAAVTPVIELPKPFRPEDFFRDVPEVELTLIERGSRYGDFTDNARISQRLKDICTSGHSWQHMDDVHREGITMILQKIARICNGDPSYADNWHDIQGYAKLVEDRLSKQPK